MDSAHFIVKTLEAFGVDTVFGYPGAHTATIYDALIDSPIRHVLVRHEQAAGFMADGYARATGKVGVCLTTAGPGATNAATAIASAYSDSVPVLHLTAQVASKHATVEDGAFHEMDLLRVFEPMTKWAAQATTPDDVPRLLMQALEQVQTGRPRPVFLALPHDLLIAIGCRFGEISTSGWSMKPPDLIHIDIAASVIGHHYASRVGIVADARSALAALAGMLPAEPREPWLTQALPANEPREGLDGEVVPIMREVPGPQRDRGLGHRDDGVAFLHAIPDVRTTHVPAFGEVHHHGPRAAGCAWGQGRAAAAASRMRDWRRSVHDDVRRARHGSAGANRRAHCCCQRRPAWRDQTYPKAGLPETVHCRRHLQSRLRQVRGVFWCNTRASRERTCIRARAASSARERPPDVDRGGEGGHRVTAHGRGPFWTDPRGPARARLLTIRPQGSPREWRWQCAGARTVAVRPASIRTRSRPGRSDMSSNPGGNSGRTPARRHAPPHLRPAV